MDNTALVSKSLPSYLRRALSDRGVTDTARGKTHTKHIPGGGYVVPGLSGAANARVAEHMWGRRAARQFGSGKDSAGRRSVGTGRSKERVYAVKASWDRPPAPPAPPAPKESGYVGRDALRTGRRGGFDPLRIGAVRDARRREAELERRIGTNRASSKRLVAEQRAGEMWEAEHNAAKRAAAQADGRRTPPWVRADPEFIGQRRRGQRRAQGETAWTAPRDVRSQDGTVLVDRSAARRRDARAAAAHQQALGGNAERYGGRLADRRRLMIGDLDLVRGQRSAAEREMRARVGAAAAGGTVAAVGGGAGIASSRRGPGRDPRRSPWVA